MVMIYYCKSFRNVLDEYFEVLKYVIFPLSFKVILILDLTSLQYNVYELYD